MTVLATVWLVRPLSFRLLIPIQCRLCAVALPVSANVNRYRRGEALLLGEAHALLEGEWFVHYRTGLTA